MFKRLYKRTILILIVALLFLFIPYVVFAQDISNDSFETEKAENVLDESTRKTLDEIGAADGVYSDFNIANIFDAVSDELSSYIITPVKCLGIILAVIVLISVLLSFDNVSQFAELAGILAISAAILPEFIRIIENLSVVCATVSGFLLASIPVYAGLIIASGAGTAGTSYGAVTLTVANIVSVISDKFVVPVLSVLLGLSMTSSFSHFNITKLTDSIYKPIKWMMVASVSVFSGIISVQTFVSSSTDAAALKTAKFFASSAIPIVGSALGDGVDAVRQSVTLLKSGAGAFGILAVIVIFLPILIRAVSWCAVCSLGVIAADIFALSKTGCFLSSCLTVVKTVFAIAISIFVISMVTAAVVICAGT